jgi:hypothetical protein
MIKKTIIAISKSCYQVIINKGSFIAAVFSDILLVLLYGFISSAYFSKMGDYVDAIGAVALSAEGIKQSISPSFLSIFFNESTKGYFMALLLLVIMFSLGIYFIFSLLFGISTAIVQNIGSVSMEKVASFIRRFFIINIAWLLFILIYQFISFYLFMLLTITKSPAISTFKIIGSILFILLVYFMFISFMLPVRVNFRNSFKKGVLLSYPLFLFYIAVLGSLLGLSFVSSLLGAASINLARFFEAAIILPFIVFVRISFYNLYKMITA